MQIELVHFLIDPAAARQTIIRAKLDRGVLSCRVSVSNGVLSAERKELFRRRACFGPLSRPEASASLDTVRSRNGIDFTYSGALISTFSTDVQNRLWGIC